MKTKTGESSKELRDNTDKSLGDERSKTDEYLSEKTEAVTQDAEDTIRFDRMVADQKKKASRAEVDLEKSSHEHETAHSPSAHIDDKNLMQEREDSDKAQALERKKEDQVRIRERFHKRLIAEALLEGERQQTDENLLEERSGIDFDSAQNSHQLSDEKSSHDLTRTALVTRDQFLAVVSHDLKNPIGVISMCAGLIRNDLEKGLATPEGTLKFVDLIEKSANNMDRMISDLLDVERMGNGKLEIKTEKGNVNELLNECRDLFSPVASSKSFTFKIEIGPETLFALFDHDRILQVLSNLIGNALKFTPRGGEITLSAFPVGQEIEIRVTDNGPGIPPDKQSKLFDRFSQLGSNDRRGLGLGLFISKWIVESHRGEISVISDEGKGSSFSFRLPNGRSLQT